MHSNRFAAILAALLFSATILASSVQSLTVPAYLSKVDKTRLAGVFKAAWPLSDAATAHYAVLGLSTLGVDAPDGACEAAKKAASPADIEAAYHASMAASLTKGCSLSGALKGIEAKLGDAAGLSAESLHQLVTVLQNEKLPLDAKKVRAAMEKLMRDDSSAGTVAHVLLTALRLGLDKAELGKLKSDMKDALLQADEADGQHLYYEKGVYTTGLVAEALVKVTDKLGEAVAPSDKLVKLANYLLSRRQIYQLKSAAQLLTALKAFADSTVQSPVVLFLKGSATLSKSGSTGVAVQLADVWGRPVTAAGISVKLASAKNVDSGAVFLKDAAMTAAAGDKSVYNVDFMKASPTVGFYQLTLTASSSEKRLLFPSTVNLEVKVVSSVAVQSMELAVTDRDQQSPPTPIKLTHPGKVKGQLEADSHQRLSAKFQITLAGDSTPATVHQAFIRLHHRTTGKEAIFVAEPDKDKVYKFSVDLATGGKNFDHQSGVYTMELIIGDALIERSLVWPLADVKLDLPEDPAAARPGAPASAQEVERAALRPKPEIKHVFRQPDKQAPASLALTFTALCLVPLIILLAMWGYLGANMSGFVASAPAVLFHLGLAGIVTLYFFYWRCLNMFETLRYLCLLGLPTFFFGNRLLRALAGEKKSGDA